MKNIFFVLLSLITLMIPERLLSYDFEQNGIYYNILDNEVLEISYGEKKYSGEITIPSKVIFNDINFDVVNVGDSAFLGCEELTRIILPNTINKIGDYAFYDCKNLQPLVLYNSLKSIGAYAFVHCNTFKKIILPNSITRINKYAF